MSHSIAKTKNRWTTAQLELLVEVWEKYYQHLKAGRGNEEVYDMMASELKEAGCLDANAKQVRGRIHNLSGKYRKEASEVLKTGIPSQWSLYSKISKFFEYSTPGRFKNLGPRVYDMSDYLDMDLVMTDVIERHVANKNRARRCELLSELELEENSLDLEDDEIEPDEDSGTADRANRDEYSDVGMYDDENTLDEFPSTKYDRRSSQSREERKNVQKRSEHEEEESMMRETEREDSDQDEDSTEEDDDDITVLEQNMERSSEVYLIKGSFRQKAIEDFLSQLYSNQLYADLMLVTCHDGVTCMTPAHRVVLANFSEFFSSMLGNLKSNTNGGPLSVCLQSDISQPIMQLLLQYMYTGKASVTRKLLPEFIRCGQILRVRGLWSDERAKVPEKHQNTVKRSFGGSADKERCTNVPFNISDEEEAADDEEQEDTDEDSSTPSIVTNVAATLLKESTSSTNSSETDKTIATDRSKKRRKKLTKTAVKKIRHTSSEEDDDDESVDMEVSSELGFDLLRSDSENEEEKATEREKRGVTGEDESKGSEDDLDLDDYSMDDYDDGDGDKDDDGKQEKAPDGKKQSVEGEENDEDEDNRTEYIDTEQDDVDGEMEYEMLSVVNGDVESVSNLSTGATTPVPSLAQSEAHSEKENIEHNERIERNGSVKGKSRQSSISLENGQLEKLEQTAPVKPIAKPPDIRRALQVVPSTSRAQPPNGNTTSHNTGNNPEQYAASRQDPAQPSTSRSALLRKVRSVYSCKICGDRFKTSDTWVEHIVYEHYERNPITNEDRNPDGHKMMLQCDLCSKFLSSEYYWVHHVLKKHTERYPHFHEDFSHSDE
ncbi:uncharacterized protein LOC126561659 [Anopheles maculipalpis]|uniref:uncharacterized protein LOC126561659 n=1 Tax=Anopheles maculipalpis TaxID=1496333 RepID=UPI0021592B8A|nr:uncharacterized protein LOC126561659 [Anopheles maculipalpis]